MDLDLLSATLDMAMEKEFEMIAGDNQEKERVDARNALEDVRL